MEPRFFNHGDATGADEMRLTIGTRFQWSHGSSTMETADRAEVELEGQCHVSMEPRFFNHGDEDGTAKFIMVPVNGVSMEPRFFNHGDPPRFSQGFSWALVGDFEHLLPPNTNQAILQLGNGPRAV
ncbi:MAG: hypothetical protein PHQ21_09335 [Firmicutes bacterium]|nr:hypothetical protein [Bacillota bacterium]